MRSRSEIEEILSAEVAVATERHKKAAAQFHSIVDDIPTTLPFPDGTLRIQLAGAESRAASALLRRALDRFNGLIIRGIVPDDLK
jgi:hypothetical protein